MTDPFTGRPLSPDQARDRTAKVDATDPRYGTPPDKFGAFFLPVQQEDKRHAVMVMIFPPEELRDQPYEVVERAIFANGSGILRGIAREIHQGYTSEPVTAAGTQNIITALQGHLDAMRGKA